MSTYELIRNFWFIAFAGSSIFLLLLFGGTTSQDLRPPQRTIYQAVTTIIFLVGVLNEFLHHRDRLPLLMLELGVLLLLTVSSIIFYRNRGKKPKLWRYTALASAALLMVLIFWHN